ncbi:MAG: hypothetical protein Q8S13_03640, partial [Dehalococcoidia bacterium]|nr:hypothetical protein [Dehalococcoidia bacterium]
MKLTSAEMLAKLGQGVKIADLCGQAGMSRREFDAWWKGETARRVPSPAGSRASGPSRSLRPDSNRDQ